MYKKAADGIVKKGGTKCKNMAMGGAVAMKEGGKAHSSKAKMQKVAKTAVKGHEKRMHKSKA